MSYGQPPYFNYGNAQNNGYNAPQQQQGYYNPSQQMQPTIPVVPPKTNKILVTSLTDAMNRTPEPNTDFIYIDQDNPFIYQVMIDMQGRKSYRTFEIKEVTEQASQKSASNMDLSIFATKDDLRVLEEKLISMANGFMQSKTKNKAEKAVGDE